MAASLDELSTKKYYFTTHYRGIPFFCRKEENKDFTHNKRLTRVIKENNVG